MHEVPHRDWRILAAFLCVPATVLAYWPGLGGPFVLDDFLNLQPVWEWLQSRRTFTEVLAASGSSPFGRPLSVLTLMANAAVSPTGTWSFKVVNLLLHLFAGALVFLVLRRIQELVPALTTGWVAAITAAWLVHPWQVSTVLYVVQRMAILGAIAQLAAVLIYLAGRSSFATDPIRGRMLLFVCFPIAVGIGFLAKETALLAPLLCLGIELVLGRKLAASKQVWYFFLLFLVLPLLACIVAVTLDPTLLGNFALREFSLSERVITQPRVLWDYIFGWYWPSADHIGMYRDGYVHSRGLLAPPSTLFAILGLAALLVVAWRTRHAVPLFSLGVFFFLGAHALEAGPLSLEPYYEHRNYLASLGLCLVAAAALIPAGARLPVPVRVLTCTVTLALLLVLTHGRASDWATFDSHLAAEAPPGAEISRRLQVMRAIRAGQLTDWDGVDQALRLLAASPREGDQAMAVLWRARFECSRSGRLSSSTSDQLRAAVPPVLTHSHVSALDQLAVIATRDSCQGLDASHVRDVARRWIDSASQRVARPRKLEAMLEILESATRGGG